MRFNAELVQFERDTSNQVLVVVYRKMQSDSDIEDYTYRVKDAWKVGQTGKNNGVVLFVFLEDAEKTHIEVGYGLEGALPDVTAFDIAERNIKPRFRNDDYQGGLGEGIDLICKAIPGEYRGTGRSMLNAKLTMAERLVFSFLFIVLIILLIAIRASRRRGGYGYTGFGLFPFWNWGSGGAGGSGSSGGGFGGFSAGGGIGGGGGAGSSW